MRCTKRPTKHTAQAPECNVMQNTHFQCTMICPTAQWYDAIQCTIRSSKIQRNLQHPPQQSGFHWNPAKPTILPKSNPTQCNASTTIQHRIVMHHQQSRESRLCKNSAQYTTHQPYGAVKCTIFWERERAKQRGTLYEGGQTLSGHHSYARGSSFTAFRSQFLPTGLGINLLIKSDARGIFYCLLLEKTWCFNRDVSRWQL